MSSGWVKLHRKILEWEWYDDHNTCRLFVHIILKASHKDRKWKGVDICSGSFVTGRKVLATETGLSEQKIRTSLSKLKSTNEITINPCNKYSIITVNNWDSLQGDNQQDDPEETAKEPTNNQQITTDKNVKKEKKERKKNTPSIPSLDEVVEYAKEKVPSGGDPAPYIEKAKEAYDYYNRNMREMNSKSWVDVNGNPVKNWKLKMLNVWLSNVKQKPKENFDDMFKEYSL